jgi:RNA polymerase sigma factor (sigma-70 family)
MEQSIRWHAVAGAYEHHRDQLVSNLSRIYPRTVVEDAVQDLFLALARNGFGDPSRLTDRYLWRAVNRAVRRRLRLESSRLGRLAERALAGEGDHAASPDGAGLDAVDAEALARALQAVDPRELEVFRMLICQGMSYREAACALGTTEHDVTNRRVRGLRRLRDRVQALAG